MTLRLAEIEREKKIAGDLLRRQTPRPEIEAKTLAKVFSTFVRFKRLGTQDKRKLLTAIAPEILVANYAVKGLYLPSGFGTGGAPTDVAYLTAARLQRVYVPIAA